MQQAQQIFMATRVLSYRVFFFTLHSLGLHLDEGLRLQVGDLDSDRMRVQIRNAKGSRDRFVPLPENTLQVLRNFWKVHRNPTLLFPNRMVDSKKRTWSPHHGIARVFRPPCAMLPRTVV